MRAAVLARRLLLVPPTLLGVALIVFVLLRVVAGDPVAMMISPGASAADIRALHAHYGLDKPIPVQLVIWLGAMLHGDLGQSITSRIGVVGLVLRRLPATIELVLLATLIALALGSALALLGAAFRRTGPEWLIDGVIAVALAIPDFVWGLLFILVFDVMFPILPVSGRIDPSVTEHFATNFYLIESLLTGHFAVAGGLLSHAILPATALALPFAAVLARVLKTSLGDAEHQDYIQMARARGYSRARVLLAEALPNAIIPTAALTGVQITFMLAGTVLVERVFSYEGIGSMAIDAVTNRDLPLIQGIILAFAVMFVAINLTVDIGLTFLDPRLRHG
jgi:ABC-type dipeptide/oligopeptide/nickel transport system permease component